MRGLRNRSAMRDFGALAGPKLSRSRFRRPSRYKGSIDAGYLYPVFVDEVLPGDTFNMNVSAVSRLATPIHPIMDNIMVNWFFFFVPNRLVWSNWKRFQGERVDPSDSIDYLVPQVAAPASTGFAAESLYDYLGIPPGIDGFNVNNLVPRAYNLIWNEWFRHTWLQDSVVVDLDDGPDDPADYVLLRRCKRADYFTGCQPAPQRGDAIELPLGDKAYIVSDAGVGAELAVYDNVGASNRYLDTTLAAGYVVMKTSAPANGRLLYADLSNATASTVNDIREAIQLQRILEKDARGGTRYVELLQNFWGVYPEDHRLQRPEYLGGGSRPLRIDAIPQTSETGTTVQGTLAGVGYNQTAGIGFSRSFKEHGHIIGLVNVNCDQTWQEGVRRMWSRRTRYDFAMPQTAHLGEMAVLNKEIYVQGTSDDDEVFGYLPQWDDMRYFPSLCVAQMRSDHATSLDAWHLGYDHSALPVLNDTFIQDDPPIDRVVSVPSEPQLIVDCYFDLVCARVLPMFGVPGMVDHF